jgi:hypothetical protein
MQSPLAVELVGYLDATVGVGEAARRYVTALRSVGVEVLEHDVSLPGRDPACADLPSGPRPSPDSISCNLVCLNPEQMTAYLDGSEAPQSSGRCTVGVWSWEVDMVPGGWREAALRLDDVWTYSSFAADLISPGIDAPVQSIPPPISKPSVVQWSGAQLPKGFRVLLIFDFLSTLERKNPLGAIEAFKRAFQPNDGAVLVVKSVNGRHRSEQQAKIVAVAEDRADILFIDQAMTGSERDALVASCDCYLSLHRSEGHGLVLAEAMTMGKPVIATAYGGNMEFMNEHNSYPVAWTPTRVGEGVEHYPAGASWAEPDVDHAVRLLRAVYEDPQSAECRALQGQADVLAGLAPTVIGERIRVRLEQLGASKNRTKRGLIARLARRCDVGK